MDIIINSFVGILMCGFFVSSTSQVRDCPDACRLQFRCNPYDKNLFWAISEGVCRAFQNGCFFSTHNCQRENECLQPVNSTSKASCMEYCPVLCPVEGPQVCATFSYVDVRGMNRDRQRTFQNRCYLDQFACQNDNGKWPIHTYIIFNLNIILIAYIGKPSIGAC
ncbi:hypothetical protein KR074_001513 [Drosophila pseudoananassae]|nr:hypothetical protein KR074_001513 [Drosophila pseudoananassae]